MRIHLKTNNITSLNLVGDEGCALLAEALNTNSTSTNLNLEAKLNLYRFMQN